MGARGIAATLMGALLATACAAPRPPAASGPPAPAPGAAPWWRGAVFYEVVVRSFQDSDGDGKGGLRGNIAT